MAVETEIIKARSESAAFEEIAALYPRATDITLISRRNEQGRFSRRGQTFLFRVEFTPEEPAPEELGEDEY